MAETDRPVVSDTTPLIKLVGVGLLDLLPQLYGSIWVPDAVYHEYATGMRVGDPALESLPWLRVVPFDVHDLSLPVGLGIGEAATISLASAEEARAVLLDEQLARRIARQRGLPIVGTLGVLLAAKQSGYLPAIKPVVDQMIAQGRHISVSLRLRVLGAAGEAG